MTTLFVGTYHHEVLSHWRNHNASKLKVLHLDFHCDMRGLLIDRRSERAYQIWDKRPGVDPGNFLTHAIVEGRIERICWVHDDPGGRRDDALTVKYESDLTSRIHLMLIAYHKRKGIPLNYDVNLFSPWQGPSPDNCLDLDWDFFASHRYHPQSVKHRIKDFFTKTFPASIQEIYLTQSPDHCHPSQHMFEEFKDELANFFNADVVALGPIPKSAQLIPLYSRFVPHRMINPLREIYHGSLIKLKKRGIY